MRAGSSARGARGFTYLGVLFLIMLLGLAMAGAGDAWWLAGRRAKERDLLWVGTQYARAIKAYRDQSPGTRQYPASLEDLVEDRRFPEPRHHLRQLYADPVTRERFHTVLSPEGRIAGVRSSSDDAPLKQENFPQRWRDFKGSGHYSDWLFTAEALTGGKAAANTGTNTGTGSGAETGVGGSGTPPAGNARPVRPGPVISIAPSLGGPAAAPAPAAPAAPAAPQ
jgi:type II secretory pathway pseudopilin PulG